MALTRIAHHALPAAAAGLVIGLAASADPQRPGLLVNTTPSEPEGLYVRTQDPPAVGRLIAFRMPEAAYPYADAHLPQLRRELVLKRVAAGAGDAVCTARGRLVIGGQDRALIAVKDRSGEALPRWQGCRVLAADELFVFSDRVPNSFDSRYFGPVRAERVVGVYTPLALSREAR